MTVCIKFYGPFFCLFGRGLRAQNFIAVASNIRFTIRFGGNRDIYATCLRVVIISNRVLFRWNWVRAGDKSHPFAVETHSI